MPDGAENDGHRQPTEAAPRLQSVDILWETINDWWDEIEAFIETRVTNARTEAANTGIKHIKRTGRGYRNHHYQRRILLRSLQATAANCE